MIQTPGSAERHPKTNKRCAPGRKQRRKCDERRPVCGNCERRRNNVVCQWPTGRDAFLDRRHAAKKLKSAKEKWGSLGANPEKYKERLIVAVSDGFGGWNGHSEDSASESGSRDSSVDAG